MPRQADYSKKAAEVYSRVSKEYFKKFHETCEFIDKFISFLPERGSILDVGCGTGPNSGYLRDMGFLVEVC